MIIFFDSQGMRFDSFGLTLVWGSCVCATPGTTINIGVFLVMIRSANEKVELSSARKQKFSILVDEIGSISLLLLHISSDCGIE